MQSTVVVGADWTLHPWRHNSSNVGGVTTDQARHNSSNVGGVTAGQVRHNSSICKAPSWRLKASLYARQA